jgi:hypothetical protein
VTGNDTIHVPPLGGSDESAAAGGGWEELAPAAKEDDEDEGAALLLLNRSLDRIRARSRADTSSDRRDASVWRNGTRPSTTREDGTGAGAGDDDDDGAVNADAAETCGGNRDEYW